MMPPSTMMRLSRSTPPFPSSTVLDGKGGVLRDKRIMVEGGIITAIEGKAYWEGAQVVVHRRAFPVSFSIITAIEGKAYWEGAPVDYDLRGLTLLPGWIDAHAHITWNFGKDGKNAGMGGTSQEDAYQSASNAWVTLMAGFTTVQSPGAGNDIPLRDAIAKGMLAGPRILTGGEALVGEGGENGAPGERRGVGRETK